MAHVINFSSGNFDISGETPNPINPLAGESLLNWLRGKLSATNCETTKPATEDWGWYIDVKAFGSSYLVGASADAHEPVVADVEWALQIHKHRSLMEKVRGKNKLAGDDPLSALIEKLLREEPGIRDVVIDKQT